MNDEISKYKKRLPSNISKAKKKAKHKHDYRPCLLKESGDITTKAILYPASYCTICGKIGQSAISDCRTIVDMNGRKVYSAVTNEELAIIYKDYPKIEVETIFQDFVELSKIKQSIDERT